MINSKFDRLLKKGSKVLTRGYDFVEMSGLRWATCNVGAENPTDVGLYFGIGKTKGYTLKEVQKDDNEDAFEWVDGEHQVPKYDDKLILKIENDAVHANWGGLWRMPTSEEYKRLIEENNVEFRRSYNGIRMSGLLVTDKKNHSKELFFPACGFITGDYRASFKTYGDYWTSSYNGRDNDFILFGFGDDKLRTDKYWLNSCTPVYGFQVRGVIG